MFTSLKYIFLNSLYLVSALIPNLPFKLMFQVGVAFNASQSPLEMVLSQNRLVPLCQNLCQQVEWVNQFPMTLPEFIHSQPQTHIRDLLAQFKLSRLEVCKSQIKQSLTGQEVFLSEVLLFHLQNPHQ